MVHARIPFFRARELTTVASGTSTPCNAEDWGGFETEEDGVTMDGDVTSAIAGVDAERDRALAGVMLSYSESDGSCRLDPGLGTDEGSVRASLTEAYPYARLDLNARVSAWALAGARAGELTLECKDGRAMPADFSMRMGAVG